MAREEAMFCVVGERLDFFRARRWRAKADGAGAFAWTIRDDRGTMAVSVFSALATVRQQR
ncbi:MAG: hypothetical protein QF541_04170 [Lentisphaeria bacterium]|nr:hypothetical protein [Lentisphaeria bacterium]